MNTRQPTSRETSMASGVAQFWCELCSRLKQSSPESQRHRLTKMSSTFHIILASLVGIALALVATYIPSIFLPNPRRSLESGFNLILAPENSPEQVPLNREALAAMKLALLMRDDGRRDKALKLFQQAESLAPFHPDILLNYGEFLEEEDIVQAENLYAKVLRLNPRNSQALVNRHRTLPKVQQIDQDMLDDIDGKREKLFKIPKGSFALKRAMREAYYQHIYHSNALEGNTMTLSMTRAIVETRMAVQGKSLHEHNEVLGLDEALKFINSSLVRKPGKITTDDILGIHMRVLGNVHPLEAGKYRVTQVYVGDHVPPNPTEVEQHMSDMNEWLLSEEPDILHPIEFAALAHYKLVYIHPFTDGNGRTGRLLMNTILMRAGFPPVIIRHQDRHEYYEFLNQANQGDIRPFIRFVAQCTERTIDAYLAATTIYPIGHDKHPELTDEHDGERSEET